MKKLALILTLCFFCFANFALAADNETEQTAKEPAAAAKQNKLPKNRPLQLNKKKKQKIKTQTMILKF